MAAFSGEPPSFATSGLPTGPRDTHYRVQLHRRAGVVGAGRRIDPREQVVQADHRGIGQQHS